MNCLVTQVDGIAPPEVEDPPLLNTCVEEVSGETYSLLGDVERFFLGVDLKDGQVAIKVPYSAVFNERDIIFDTSTSRQITITSGGRRRRLMTSTGIKQIVVVRVSSDSNPQTSVERNAEQLYTDFFTDENNLREVYRQCSNEQLILNPATGTSLTNGVLTIQPPTNVCSMGWRDVGNFAVAKMTSLDWVADFKVIIMPDCVDFGTAAAWGETPGNTIWIPSRYSSYPVTQVHEFGHNLGHRHSGKGISPYGDDTDYMGNKASWSDVGSKLCFNGAKLWYFQWYSDFHRTVNPAVNAYEGQLAGITDVRSGEVTPQSGKDVIVRLIGETEQLFILFNRSELFNSQVAEADRITITAQASEYNSSMLVASLGVGEEFTTSDGSIIKNCGITYGSPDFAYIIIYRPGVTSAVCTFNDVSSSDFDVSSGLSTNSTNTSTTTIISSSGNETTAVCSDVSDWYDADGPYFNCEWYGARPDRCKLYGRSYANFGYTANQACCQCK